MGIAPLAQALLVVLQLGPVVQCLLMSIVTTIGYLRVWKLAGRVTRREKSVVIAVKPNTLAVSTPSIEA